MYDVKVLPQGVLFTFGRYSDELSEFAHLGRSKIRVLPQKDSEYERYKDQILIGLLSAFGEAAIKQPYAHAS
jgi:hypothetical protein